MELRLLLHESSGRFMASECRRHGFASADVGIRDEAECRSAFVACKVTESKKLSLLTTTFLLVFRGQRLRLLTMQ